MAMPNVPGFSAAFPTDTVRNGLLFAMQLGAPNDATRKVTFVKKSPGRQYFLGEVEQFQPPLGTLRLDRDGRPLDPNVRVVPTPDQEFTVDVAIELADATADEMPVGNFRPVKATITLMAQEYEQVKGCREIKYNNDRYGFSHELDLLGLFDLDFHVLVFFAINES
jgi:hypothetical protein